MLPISFLARIFFMKVLNIIIKITKEPTKFGKEPKIGFKNCEYLNWGLKYSPLIMTKMIKRIITMVFIILSLTIHLLIKLNLKNPSIFYLKKD